KLVVDAIKLLFENALRDDPALTPQQVLQNRGLTSRQLQRDAVNAYVSSNSVEHGVAGPERGTEHRSGTPQEGLCPSDEFAHRERFDEIVVGPCIEPEDPVLHRITCGEDQDRYVVSSRAQFGEQD